MAGPPSEARILYCMWRDSELPLALKVCIYPQILLRKLCRHTLRVRWRSSSSVSSIKKAIEAQKHLNGFLVEVAGLELAASSTRIVKAL